MISHTGEAIVLRGWPFQESDLLLTLFTRAQGKVRGVAKAAMKSRRRFGGALEPMTHVRAHYVEKPKQDLVRMDSFEILFSPLNERVDYPRASALAFLAELLDAVLPDHDPQDALFRLTLAVLEQMGPGVDLQLPVTYFCLWCTRLQGWLPEAHRCVECGEALDRGAWHSPARDGFFCGAHRRPNCQRLSDGAVLMMQEMLRLPVAKVTAVAAEDDGQTTASAVELRRFLTASLERHIERKLVSRVALQRSLRRPGRIAAPAEAVLPSGQMPPPAG